MDPHVKRRMRTAHLNHVTECACGRKLYGNGWRSHARNCVDWLTTHGYPLSDGDVEGLWNSGLTFDQSRKVQRLLGQLRTYELPAPVWSWREYRERVNPIIDAVLAGKDFKIPQDD